ncbi:MAG: c-type cytochrome [Gemmatimonadota bacterium]|nr:c-type cytochrome [Gemmatimonadota bacterium]
MKRALKWLGYIVGGLVAVILLAVGTVYAITSSRMGKSYPTAVETIAIPTDPVEIARGKHLTLTTGKCQNCHGDNMAGKVMMDAAVFAKLTSANLTSGKGGIGGSYTDADWVRGIRHGIGRDGKPLIFMPSEAYYHFNDADLGAVIGYLKTLQPADMTFAPAQQIGPIARMIYLFGDFPLIPAELIPRDKPRPAPVTAAVTAEYGGYLAAPGGCTTCHGQDLGGGGAIGGVKAPNLTSSGDMGKWSERDFFNVIRTGTRPDGRVLSAVMPWPYMRGLTDDEMRAIYMYIRSRPAKVLEAR